MGVGIERIGVYAGRAVLSLAELFAVRSLDAERLNTLLMSEKSVSLPWEDAVTNAVNAARPVIQALNSRERESIRMLVVATESGLDFGKSISTYVHHYLELPRNCRLFEIKQACYGGTAALQLAASFVAASEESADRALVIASDEARPSSRMTYAEPSQGMAGVAMLISKKPDVLEIDRGAFGCYSFEVMDTCRPTSDIETGDPDTSILAYLDCLKGSYANYVAARGSANVISSFQYLVFHTPFGGMVKGAHRALLRENTKLARQEIEEDFKVRVAPSLRYSMRIGNAYSASVYLGLCSALDTGNIIDAPVRVGLFSYGSGCSSEFFSGVVAPVGQRQIADMALESRLNDRCRVSVEEYDRLLDLKRKVSFGTENLVLDLKGHERLYEMTYPSGSSLLRLDEVRGFHRRYSFC